MLAHGGGLPELTAVLLPVLLLVLVAWRLGRGAAAEDRGESEGGEGCEQQSDRPSGAEKED